MSNDEAKQARTPIPASAAEGEIVMKKRRVFS